LVGIDSNTCNIHDTAYIDVVVRDDSLVADFLMTDSGGCIPLIVNFSLQADSTSKYYWTFGDGGTADSTPVTHTYTSAGTFQIRLIVIDSSYCNFSDTSFATIVTIDSVANADFVFSRIFHGCDSVQVILWSAHKGEESELWDFGDGFQIVNADTVSHSYTTPGSYTITHYLTDTNMICKPLDTSSIVISLNPLQISVAIPDTGGCVPFVTNFTGNSGLVTTDYHWYFGDGSDLMGDTVNHTYNSTGIFNVTVIAIDTNACNPLDSSFAQITVINDSAHADFQLNVLNDCDSNLVIDLVNQSANQLQYFWSFGDSTFSTQQQENHTYHLPGTYTVKLLVIDTNRCNPFDSISKSVTMLPNVRVDFSADNVCLGNAVQFNNLSNPSAQFDWDFDDGNSSNQYSPGHSYLSIGTYSVSLMIVDSATCDVRDTVVHDVTVYQSPVADFYTVGDTFKFETPVQFTNTSTYYNYLFWNFGDGTFATDEEAPVHTYGRIYDMIVCLIAANDECADTLCKTIYISFEKLIGVPNAFTPNGDGINDVVKIEGKGIVELVFRIYNRWGEKVFETRDKNMGWDGIYKGTLQEMDVFTYAADATLINGEQVMLKGNITLLR
ncbi:MAG: PKD domain-containing protein, partial [Bacteroidota bacterium]